MKKTEWRNMLMGVCACLDGVIDEMKQYGRVLTVAGTTTSVAMKNLTDDVLSAI